MSVYVIDRVWKNAPYNGNTLLVLLALADWSNDEGMSFPKVGTLAKKARQSVRSTQYALERLKKAGILTVEINSSGNRAPSNYQIDLQTLHPSRVQTTTSTGASKDNKGCKTQHSNKEEPSGTVREPEEATKPEIPPAVKPRTDGKPELREVDSFSWDDFHPTQAAHKLLEHLELPKARANHEAVTAALESLKRKMPLSEAFHFLLSRAFDGIAAGERVTQFWFTNAAYKHAPGEKASTAKPKPKPKPAMTIQEVLARQKEGKF